MPIVRQFAWISLIPHVAFMGLLMFVYHFLNLEYPFIYVPLTYLMLSFGLRSLIAKYHKQGVKFVKQRQFTSAIPCFEKSVNFFSKNNWVDRYRFLTLLSSSRMAYKEMGLCNIAFCYSQTGNGQKAIEYYEKTLKEFPENGIAVAALNLINSTGQRIYTENEK